MDLDAYLAATAADRTRLEQLLAERRLSGAQADELVELYQRVSTQLSVVRSNAPDPTVVQHLSVLLAGARNRTTGTRTSTWTGFLRFFTHRFPAALYRLRWWWLGMMAANVVLTAVMLLWLLAHPEVQQSVYSPQQIEQLVEHDFENYYSEHAASSFATQVWINNAWASFICIAFGVLGLPVVYVMFTNIYRIADCGALMHRYDRGDLFWGLLMPHGLLELTAFFVAGGVGLRLFWSWIDPRSLTRGQSMAREGRTAGGIALGLIVVLLISGIIEAFVTPSPLPTWARVGIGVLAELAFFAYVFIVGRAAASHGETGDIDERLLEDRVATQA